MTYPQQVPGYPHPQQVPGYPQPVPPPPPPPKRRGLFLAGIAIGLTMAVVTAVVLFTGVFTGGDESADPDGSASSAEDASTRYTAPSDSCGELDLSGYEAVLPATGPASETDYETNSNAESAWQCTAEFADDSGTAAGELSLIVHLYSNADEAERQFERVRKLDDDKWTDTSAAGSEKPAEGEWKQGLTAYGKEAADTGSQETLVQDGNMYLSVYFSVYGVAHGDSDESALTALEFDTVEQLMSDLAA